MVFFFIGGVVPKTVRVDDKPRDCAECGGQGTAYLQRVDHYFSLFFVRLFPLTRGEPFLQCEKCNTTSLPGDAPARSSKQVCSNCGWQLQPEFRFCPICGSSLF
eukprot:GILK01016657.1.p1 GENE.GILK01016657.1~~GILK01016657.1.p1  ORF type:complete len:104 (-),score=1.03 GILK01016657.1:240-551(-)